MIHDPPRRLSSVALSDRPRLSLSICTYQVPQVMQHFPSHRKPPHDQVGLSCARYRNSCPWTNVDRFPNALLTTFIKSRPELRVFPASISPLQVAWDIMRVGPN